MQQCSSTLRFLVILVHEIDGDFDDVAIKTFKVGLPAEHGLRKSVTEKPITSEH